jgi:proteasome lid subunit RPN8/RPN11
MPAAAALRQAVEAAYPEEGCGLLIGRREGPRIVVARALPSPNLAQDRRHHFEVDPRLRFSLQRELRGGLEDIVGHFHSHPDGPAEPSASDLECAYEPALCWLIASVAGGRQVALNGFRVTADRSRFEAVPLALA